MSWEVVHTVADKKTIFEKMIVKNSNTGRYGVCFYDPKEYRYFRPLRHGSVVSSGIDYVMIGAKTCKTMQTATKWLNQ